jgi:uncharacterized protein (TIGR02284 family)
MSISRAIANFNSLIVINNDRIIGYQNAADEIDEPDLKEFFRELSKTSVKCKDELSDEVRRLGGVPNENIANSEKLLRVWMEIKAAFTGSDIGVIVKFCEYGETITLDIYKNVLIQEVHEINSPEQHLLNRQYALLKKDYEKVKIIGNVLKSEQNTN